MNPTEKINIIHIPHENTPVKLEFEFLAMTVPYRELYSQSFPEYIQKIEDVLTYDKKQNLSHGVLVRRFPSQEGMVLCLLALNKGTVLTYQQIYESIWKEETLGSESNAIACHIYNIRKKFHRISPNLSFTLRCVRETGYCFEDREE